MDQRPKIIEENFNGTKSMAQAETSAMAVAEYAKAAVQARYVMALKNPRNMDDVRTKLLRECKRPRFAEAAIYRKPVSKEQTIEGPSARFAEAALRSLSNAMPEVQAVYDGDEKVIMRVSVTDLENNLTPSQDVTILKQVERKWINKGHVVLGTRLNSYGDQVYIVRATEDEMRNKINAQVSKMRRNMSLALLPSDILDECMEACYATMRDKAAKDPDYEKKRILDAFYNIGITPKQITEYLHHPLDAIQPAEIEELRRIYASIADGEAKWADFIAETAPPKDTTKTDAVKEKLKNRKKKAVNLAKTKKSSAPKNKSVDLIMEAVEKIGL